MNVQYRTPKAQDVFVFNVIVGRLLRRTPILRKRRLAKFNGVDQFDVDKFAAVMPGDVVEVIQSLRGGPAESNREPVVVGRGR